MDYYSLFKIYAMENNLESFNKIYDSRFNNESSYHFPLEISSFPAFLYYHPSIADKIAQIYRLDKEVSEAFDKLPGIAQKQYIKKSLIDEVEMTNEIEGVVSTRKEINDLIVDIENKIEKKNRLESIVKKYLLLMKNKEISLKSSKEIRNLYDEFLLDEIKNENPENVPDGELFRKGHVHVEKLNGEVVHNGVNPESQIIQYVDISLNILNDLNLDPILRTCVFHYLFAYAHPFYDGNGRMSRFITSYVFSKTLTPIISYRLSMNIKEHLSKYYEAFTLTNDKRNRGDIGTFVFMFLDIIKEGMEKTILYASSKKRELDDRWKRIISLKLDVNNKEQEMLYYLLQARLFSEFGITINEIIKINEKTPKTNRKILNSLIIKNYAYKEKAGYTYHYFLNNNIFDLSAFN